MGRVYGDNLVKGTDSVTDRLGYLGFRNYREVTNISFRFREWDCNFIMVLD